MLLDSQVLIWLLDDDRRLSSGARERLASAPRVFFSAASTLELTIKSMLGRLELPEGWVDRLGDAGLSALSITPEHTAGLVRFPELVGHDPFDRILMAQALVEQIPLLTADRVLLGLGLDWVVDAGT